MAVGFMVASAAIGAVGSVSQSNAMKRQAKTQRELDAENLALQKKETAESIRRTKKDQVKVEGQIETDIGASGFEVGGSLDKYLESVKEEHSSDLDWMRTSGASRDAIAEREAAARYSATRSQATGTLIGGIGTSIGQLGGAASQYKKTGWGF